MARKKLSPLVQAMNIFGQLDDRDKQTLADWIKSQTATPHKPATKKKKTEPILSDISSGAASSSITQLPKSQGSANVA